jgi:hypothetical protein
MPIRAFVTATLDDLTKEGGIIQLLEQAQRTGSLHSLRNNSTGFLSQATPLTADDVDRRYKQARYEAYLRVLAMDDGDQKTALKLQWTNPWTEKIMRVEVSRDGYFIPNAK